MYLSISTEGIFNLIVARGHTKPDTISYNALINAAVKAGETARAEWWLAAMITAGVAPGVVSYTTVLHAYARAGEVDATDYYYYYYHYYVVLVIIIPTTNSNTINS